MNNERAISLVEDCSSDLERISLIIEELGGTDRAIQYLTKYSIIKVCGTLEQCFKTIISDFSTLNQNQQLKNYVDSTFRESSINPNINNIYNSLAKFDENWKANFKLRLNADENKSRILSSLQSLNNARNEFAHGGNPNTTFNDVKNYFLDAKAIIEYIDASMQ